MDASCVVRILGSAAGGGYPQWNCRCPVCALAWNGDARVVRRTQSSIAVRGRAGEWALVNASPDIRQQLLENPPLQPRRGPRGSPLVAVVFTNADIDHIAGLLGLRERWPLRLFATRPVLMALAANPIFRALDEALVERREIVPGVPFHPVPDVEMELFPVPGKAPLWDEGEEVRTDIEDGRTVGVALRGVGADAAWAHYVPGCAAVTDALLRRLAGTALLLFDGTLYADDEMIRLGLGPKTGRRMGHIPVGGPDGSLAALAGCAIARKAYVHINNSNPLLVAGSPERREAEAAGWLIAEDGMEFSL
jgi:pyrroloquinoline quinone biosynthesis protein B